MHAFQYEGPVPTYAFPWNQQCARPDTVNQINGRVVTGESSTCHVARPQPYPLRMSLLWSVECLCCKRDSSLSISHCNLILHLTANF